MDGVVGKRSGATVAGREGLAAIYTALPSPFNAAGGLDLQALSSLVQRLEKVGVEGFYACGSTGECFLLEEGERKAALEAVVGAVKTARVVAHVGTMSTASSVSLARHAAAQGAIAVSATPPLYFSYGLEEVSGYYADIADASGLPVLVYHVPNLSGKSFGVDRLAELLRVPGVVGLKHTSMNLHEMERLRRRYPEKLILSGFDEVFLPALSMGADGMIGSTVNLMPELFLGIRSAFRGGDWERASALQKTVNDVIESLTRCPSFFPALKFALSLVGSPCGNARKPFMTIGEEQKRTIKKVLTESGLIRDGSQ